MNVAEANKIINRHRRLCREAETIAVILKSSKPLIIGVVEREFDGHRNQDCRIFIEVDRHAFAPLLQAAMNDAISEIAALEADQPKEQAS